MLPQQLPTGGLDVESLAYSKYVIVWVMNMLNTNLDAWPFISEAQGLGSWPGYTRDRGPKGASPPSEQEPRVPKGKERPPMPAPVSTTLVLGSRDSIGKRVRDSVHQARERRGVKPVEIDTVADEEKIANEVMGAIKGADLIIADLSGHNPNVLYELGFAHALRKPTVLLRSTKSGFARSASRPV